MNKVFGLSVAVLMIFCMASAASADTTYNTWGLKSLAHGYYYTWGLNQITVPTGQEITSAILIFNDIRDWSSSDTTNVLYVNLLNLTPHGLGIYYNSDNTYNLENDKDYGNYFTSNFPSDENYFLGSWTDTKFTGSTVQFTIPQTYYSWLTSGNFSFGLDPDCHFYEGEVTFTVTTAPVSTPEPATLLLLGLGLAGLAVFSRKLRTAPATMS